MILERRTENYHRQREKQTEGINLNCWRAHPCHVFACRDGVWVGSGVSQVQAAFVTTLAAMYGNRDDRALQLDRRCLHLEVGYQQPIRGESYTPAVGGSRRRAIPLVRNSSGMVDVRRLGIRRFCPCCCSRRRALAHRFECRCMGVTTLRSCHQ